MKKIKIKIKINKEQREVARGGAVVACCNHGEENKKVGSKSGREPIDRNGDEDECKRERFKREMD